MVVTDSALSRCRCVIIDRLSYCRSKERLLPISVLQSFAHMRSCIVHVDGKRDVTEPRGVGVVREDGMVVSRPRVGDGDGGSYPSGC